MNNNISNSFLYIILIILVIIVSIGLYYKYSKIKNDEKNKKKKIKEGATSIGKIFTSIGKIFTIIGTFPKRIANIGKGIGNIFKGIGQEFTGVVAGTALGFKDIVLLVYYGSYFLFTYIACGVQYITNIPKCFFYYMVDIFFCLIYLPVTLTLFVTSFAFPIVYVIESLIWKYIYKTDIMQYNFTGFRLTRWPKSIRDKCYNCKRLKISVVSKKGKDVHIDFTKKIPRMFMQGINTMRTGGKQMLGGFF